MYFLIILALLVVHCVAKGHSNVSEVASWWNIKRYRRLAYCLVFTTSAGLVWWAWGGTLSPVCIYADEFAYLLQAEIFSKGELTAPARPDPMAFSQYHVFDSPRVAAKYFPGHSIMLIPGVLLNFPVIVPLLLAGINGVLLLALACALSGPIGGLLTWTLWASSGDILLYHGSYLSATTSSAAWTTAWLGLLLWMRNGNRPAFIMCAAGTAVITITRPLSAVGLGIVMLGAICWHWIKTTRPRQKALREMMWGICVLGLSVVILGISNWSLTGSVLSSGHGRYAREYWPHDKLGFGIAAFGRSDIEDQAKMHRIFEEYHRKHTIERLHKVIGERLDVISRGLWGDGRISLGILAVVGLLRSHAFAQLWGSASVLLFMSYLLWAHEPKWSVYYVEGYPAIFFFCALGGIAAVTGSVRFLLKLKQPLFVRRAAISIASGFAAACCFAASVADAANGVRRLRHRTRTYYAQYWLLEKRMPGNKKIVFIRYSRTHNVHRPLIVNGPYLEKENTWRVYDLGSDVNARLLNKYHDRSGWIFLENEWRFIPIATGRNAD